MKRVVKKLYPWPPGGGRQALRSLGESLTARRDIARARPRALRVTRESVSVEGLPAQFEGFRVAFASDFHHSIYVPLKKIRAAVNALNALCADVIILGGDYVTHWPRFFGPAFSEFARLSAPLGVYSVPGNHDYWSGLAGYHAGAARASIIDVTNRGVAVEREGAQMWISGLADGWVGSPDPAAAMALAPRDATRIVVTHSPTLADSLPPGYAALILAGHTHGWQIYIPGVTRLIAPATGSGRYRAGLYETPAGPMYVTRGVGMVGVPMRLRARAEVVEITLTGACRG